MLKGELEVIYNLAFHLHMPVYRLMAEMPYDELLNWLAYFDGQPIGWREDQRFAMVLQAAGVKEAPSALFQSLGQMKKNADELAMSKTNMSNFRNSVMFSKLAGAVGGDNILNK